MKPQPWHRLLAQGAQPETFFSHQQKSLELWGLGSLSFLLLKGQDIDKALKRNLNASICSVRTGSHYFFFLVIPTHTYTHTQIQMIHCDLGNSENILWTLEVGSLLPTSVCSWD